ncbi:hypothetical protein ABH966_004361 [Lysinibacillus sp. RC46]
MSRLGKHDVGHEGVITGRDGFKPSFPYVLAQGSDADPQVVAKSSLQST